MNLYFLSYRLYIELYRINQNDFILMLSHCKLINTYFMKADDQLQSELLKLNTLAPSPLDSSFLIGYLAYALPSGSVPQIKPTVNNIISLMKDGLISSQNVLQLLVVLRFKIFMSDYETSSKRLVPSIDNYINQLALDNQYLTNKYLAPPPKLIQKKSEGMGIECSICLVQISYSALCLLSCNHMFHRQCFNEHAKAKIEGKNIPFYCPQEGCNRQISLEEISQFLNKAQRDKYDEFMFQVYVEHNTGDTSWCPTPGCQAVFAFDEALTNYKCPTCKKHYCLRCKCEMHTGVSCEEYRSMAHLSEDDKKFMVLAKGAKYKQCPSCKFWVEKNEGCDHMTCRCKYQFCYVCGGKYGACRCNGGPQLADEMPMMRPIRPMLPRIPSEEFEVRSLPSEHREQFSDEESEIAYFEDLFRKAEEKSNQKKEQKREDKREDKREERKQEKRQQKKEEKRQEKREEKLQKTERMQFLEKRPKQEREEKLQKKQKQQKQQKLQMLEKQEHQIRQILAKQERQEMEERYERLQKQKKPQKFKFSQRQKRLEKIITQQKQQKIQMADLLLKTQKLPKPVTQLKQEKQESKNIESIIRLFKQQKQERQKVVGKPQSKDEKVEVKSSLAGNKLNYVPYSARSNLYDIPKFQFSSYVPVTIKEKPKEDVVPEPKKEQ